MVDATVVGPESARLWTLAQAVAGGGCLAVLVGASRGRHGTQRLAWTLLAVSVGLFVAGALGSLVWPPLTGTGGSAVLGWLLLGGSATLAGGIAVLVYTHIPGREGLIDAAILAGVLAIPLWTFVIRPGLGTDRVWGVVGAVLGLQLLACAGALWLLLATRDRPVGVWLVAAGTGLLFVGHPSELSGLLDTVPGAAGWSEGAWLAGYIVLGAGAWDRSWRTQTAAAGPELPQRLGWHRVGLLAVALLVGPAAALINVARGVATYTVFRPVATAMIGVLVLWRLAAVAAARGRAEQHARNTAATLQAVWDSAPSGIVLVDGAGRIASANPAVQRMFGYRDDELAGTTMQQLMPGIQQPGAHTPKAVWVQELSARRKNGADFPVELRIGTIVGAGATTMTCVLTDISARKQAEQRLRQSEERFRLLVEGVRDYAIVMLDHDGRVQSWNRGAEHILGYRSDDIIGGHLARFYPPEAIQGGQPDADLRAASEQGRAQVDGWQVRADGTRLWANTVITALFTDAAALRGYAMVTHDATERRRLESELRRQALHDSLTGLPNRTLLRDRLDQALRQAARDHHQVAVLLVDLNDFKQVNDTLGHPVGDLVLKHVAQRLQAGLRQSDTVARLGGDEFAVVLPDLPAPHHAEAVATKILSTLGQPLTVGDPTLTLTASIGIAVYPLHADTEALLFQRADIAMFRAKELGTGYTFYAEHYDRNTIQRLQTIAELRTAIESGQLVNYYQPKIELEQGKIVAMEALVRWRHPTRGLLLPGHFIPIAEQTGLIKPLTAWVLTQALSDCRQWLQDHSLPVAVNLSPQSLQDPSIVDTITKALRAAQAPGGMLQLEITETSIMLDRPRAIEAMASLGEAAVRFAIDDFGTGYSSLAQLLDLPVEEIKIDRSFVADMTTCARATSIVRAVIDLADNLGLRVVAEGVENDRTHKRLQDLGCHCAQGFLYQAPAPLKDATINLSQQ